MSDLKNAKQETEDKVDISVLFNEDTSDEAKEKISTIFETAVGAKASELLADEVAQRDDIVEGAVAEIGEQLTEATDGYFDYVAEKWLTENKIAVESAFEVERARSLMEGLIELVAGHGMDIPEGADDVVQGLIDSNEELHERLNEAHNEIMALRALIEERELTDVVEEVSAGLKDTQRVKLNQLAEEIRYTDVDDFRKKIVAVKESFFKDVVHKQTDAVKDLSEEVAAVDDKKYTPIGHAVVDAINAAFTSKK